jgi:hypothetical protein
MSGGGARVDEDKLNRVLAVKNSKSKTFGVESFRKLAEKLHAKDLLQAIDTLKQSIRHRGKENDEK